MKKEIKIGYWSNGNKKYINELLNDLLDGLQKTWWHNTQVAYNTSYKKGIQHGIKLEFYYC